MKMSVEILLLVIVVVILVSLFFYFAGVVLSPGTGQSLPDSGTVCVKDTCFNVEVAKTPAQRDRGLMYKENLGKDKGMLFIFEKEGIYPFWMKNTLIPLDIIWIDSGNKIVFVGQNIQPCKTLICPTVFPTAKAKYVLEVNAGICQQIGLKVGDQLEIKN